MTKPWEKYAQQPQAEGPWAKYGAAPAAPEGLQFNDQERFEGFSFGDRLAVKNFSNSAESAAEYLRKQNPNIEVAVKDGEIFGRNKGEGQYRALDPNTGFFSRDFARDVGDVLYDVGSGIIGGGATALGGIAGGLPGAAVAGAGSSGFLETARQGIGSALGINQEIDGGDIGVAAGLGAASPLLFGTGASAAQIGKKAAEQVAKSGRTFLTPQAAAKGLEEATEQVAKSQRGVLGHAYQGITRNVLPAVGEKLSGANRETIKRLNSYLPQFDQLDEMGRTQFVTDATSELQGALEGATNKTWKAFEEALEKSPMKVDATDELVEFGALAGKARQDAMALGNEEAMKQAEQLASLVEKTLSTETKRQKPKIDVAGTVKTVVSDVGEKLRLEKHEAWNNYKQSLDQQGIKVNVAPALEAFNGILARAEREAAELGTEAARSKAARIAAARNSIFKKIEDEADAAPALLDFNGKPLPTRQAPESFIGEVTPDQALAVKRELSNLAELSSIPAHGNSIGNRFSQGATQLDKDIASTALAAANQVEEELFKFADNASKEKFVRISQLERRLKSKLNNPETAEATLRRLDPDSKAVLFEELAAADKEFRTNLVGTAKAIQESGEEVTERSAITPVLSPMAALKLQRQLEDVARRQKAINPEDRLGQTASLLAQRLEKKIVGALGEGASDNLSTYKYAKGMKDVVMPHFKDAERANRTLGNLGGRGKKVLQERLGEVDAQFGTDTLEKARMLEAANIFAKPSLDPLSSGGTTSTSRTIPASAGLGSIGYWLGANFIPGQGGAGIGAGLGIGLGSMLGAPATIKAGVKAGAKAEKLAKKASPARPFQTAPISAWNALHEREQQRDRD